MVTYVPLATKQFPRLETTTISTAGHATNTSVHCAGSRSRRWHNILVSRDASNILQISMCAYTPRSLGLSSPTFGSELGFNSATSFVLIAAAFRFIFMNTNLRIYPIHFRVCVLRKTFRTPAVPLCLLRRIHCNCFYNVSYCVSVRCPVRT